MSAIQEYMERDHARIDGLLRDSVESNFDSAFYNEFRSGLLRHIAIEEKILFPVLREQSDLGPILTRLRLHHGALGALLVPKPTPQIVRAIQDILEYHNKLEEGDGGVYSRISAQDQQVRIEQIETYPSVPLSSAVDRLTDLGPVRRAMERAGFEVQKYLPH